MNERIQELAEQAGFMVDQSGHIMVCFTSDGNDEVKKFTQLIVKECANIVNSLEQYEGSGDCYIAEYIKEHFGVE